jgi:steroid delta-isomerase-like uncharacterized protein
MTAKEQKALIHSFVEHLFNKRVEQAVSMLAPDFVYRAAGFPELRGPKEYAALYSQFFSNSPKLQFTMHDEVAEETQNGGMVAIRYSWNTVHEREFMGLPPTGRKLSVIALALFRLENGKIAEVQVLDDYLGMMRQMGAIPISLFQQEMEVPGLGVKRTVKATA